MNSFGEITERELHNIKSQLNQKMLDRNFCQKNIDYILSYTTIDTWKVAKALVEDMWAHTSIITWAIGYTNKENAALMEYAAKMKDYDAFYHIAYAYNGVKYTDFSQIKDMREK